MEDKPPNVIAFPRKNINTAALKSLEEIRADSIKNKMEYVDELTDDLLSEMFLKLNMSGIDIDITEVKYLKDVGLVVESVKSLVFKSMNIDHPIQLAADKLISIDEKDLLEFDDKT